MKNNEHHEPSGRVEDLIGEGRYQEAAEVASALHLHARAAELYERIWDFSAAASCAEEAGDLVRALGDALLAKESTRADAFADALKEQGVDGERAALEVYAEHRHFGRAAQLAEGLGETERALGYHRADHADLDVARLLVQLGRDREAGRLLERIVDNSDPSEERSQASLNLGLLLARLLQHEEAIARLQIATTNEATRCRAQRALIREFSTLGLLDAARDVLRSLRSIQPEAPATLEEFLRSNPLPAPKRSALKSAIVIGGRYKIEKLLGAGGSGRVYRARDQVSDRLVAVKRLSSSHAHGSEAYARFAREAKLSTSLRHPNIVEVYDFSEDHRFLVMELMEGDSLRERIKAGMTQLAVRRMCLDILSGLEVAHQRGIIHRDLKPANLFFDTRGIAKISDFGVAHLLDLGRTQTGGLIGTLAYMSPEQITGAPLTIAADLYSLGVTLFEALTRRLPFLGPDFVAQHLGEEPPPPSLVSDCDPSWDDVVLTLLSKVPGERYESIASFRRDLRGIVLQYESRPLRFPNVHKEGDSVITASVPSTLRARRVTGVSKVAVAQPAAKKAPQPRYAFESPIGQTKNSTLARAIDTTLGRSVIIEKYSDPLTEEEERRLYVLARGGGPFMQRVLSYERGERGEKFAISVFEAPSGAPIGERDEPLSTRLAVHLLKRLARAIAPLHACHTAHGSLSGACVLLDSRGHPTILVCGIEALGETPSSEEDVEQILRIITRAVTAATPSAPKSEVRSVRALMDAVFVGAGFPEQETLMAMPRSNGEELYALAEAIELRLLRVKQGAGA